ncbi:MAG: MFS transporter [Bdellovibrionaceae bacterium]|nr:MFS transporter [Pseudobdellovibrionaceae bacterium]
MAGFFPVFFKEYWSAGADSAVTTGRLGDVTALTGLIVALLTPFLGALADARQAKKLFLFIFMVMGLLGCFSLGLIDQGLWIYAAFWYAVATVGFNAGTTFYDSLLPSVAPGAEGDHASALGYALGYLGGGVLFLLNVAMFLSPATFGIPDGATAVKISFMTVAVWWAIFSIPLFKWVPEPVVNTRKVPLGEAFGESLRQLRRTLGDIWQKRDLRYLLLAFWLYIDGVYTVMTMAVDFGLSIGLESKDLITALLVVQFVGFPSAYLFGRFSGKFGALRLIQLCIAAYAAATILAALMSTATHFFMLAVFVGIVQGGVQALSRSLYARMIPIERSAEFFGVMNMVGRFAAILGPFLVARTTLLTGNHRWGLASLLILFAAGSYFLLKVRDPAEHPAIDLPKI